MKIFKIDSRPIPEERELYIYRTLTEDNKWKWIAETNISKYITKLKKCGWTQTSETTLMSDNTIQAAEFETFADNPITFRDLSKKRTISKDHLEKIKNAKATKNNS